MKLLGTFILCFTIFLIQIWHAESYCDYIEDYAKTINYTSPRRRMGNLLEKCWNFDPPEESIAHLTFSDLDLNDPYCNNVYISVRDDSGETERICQRFNYRENKTISMLVSSNFTVALFMWRTWDYVHFKMEYTAESLICSSKDHFRCSPYQCIRPEQVCNGVEDCANGLDESECGITAVSGVRESRIQAVDWLLNHRKNYGWGRNTHRAVTALYLTDAAKFNGYDVMEEITVKQLQLKIAASLLRNSTEPMSVNELSMYVNSLMVTCHNVRNIFSENLLRILATRAFAKSPASPGAYLTLCNANWQFSKRHVQDLLDLLTKDVQYPFDLENQAMAVMALSCLNQKTSLLHSVYNASSIYNETIQNFMLSQKKDGSFGNAHTTAMVTQALVASGQGENSQWNVKNAMSSLIKSLNTSSVDFLSVYLTLPLLKGKTLLNISNSHCGDHRRKLEDDEDILDMSENIGAKMHIQYSLYIGDNKNIIHDLYVKVPENSTIYDVMKVARIADPKYKFSHHEINGHMYIYGIAGLTNDMEAGKVWLLYVASENKSKLNQITQSPDRITLSDKDHLIMWYSSANI